MYCCCIQNGIKQDRRWFVFFNPSSTWTITNIPIDPARNKDVVSCSPSRIVSKGLDQQQ
jgi:hypothetical protein